MDLTSLIFPLVAEIAHRVAGPPSPPAAPPGGVQGFDRHLAAAATRQFLASEPVLRWPWIQDAIAAWPGQQFRQLEITAEGQVSLIDSHGQRVALDLPSFAREALLEKAGASNDSLIIPLDPPPAATFRWTVFADSTQAILSALPQPMQDPFQSKF